jgi:hypothetical protein
MKKINKRSSKFLLGERDIHSRMKYMDGFAKLVLNLKPMYQCSKKKSILNERIRVDQFIF